MQFYLAPMEGITGYVYRNAYAACFHNIDKYFSPFIVPHKNRSFKQRELKDIFPEHNQEIILVPQILTNDAEDFLRTAQEFWDMGYQEINLNLGCPSGTVTAKKKGAGFLAVPEELDRFLDQVFAGDGKDMPAISIKTRIGVKDREEFFRLLEIYRKYPLRELIIHPRLLQDFYKNTPDHKMYAWAVQNYTGKLCYNGDIFTPGHYREVISEIPETDCVMAGRGILVNPGLVRQIQGGSAADKTELRQFHDRILEGYQTMLSGDRNILFRMKEVWFYLIHSFEGHEKYAKQIKKVQTLQEYHRIAEGIFRDLALVKWQ